MEIYDFNKLSRRGIIDLAKKFDAESENSFSQFCEKLEKDGVIKDWYVITPLEIAVEHIIQSKQQVAQYGKDTINKTVKKVNHIGAALLGD